MATNVETLEKLSDLLRLIAGVIRSIPPSLLSDAGKLLQQKLAGSASTAGTAEATIKQWHDVIWLTSQMYTDRAFESLPDTEQQLVRALQAGGFLTKDPDQEEYEPVFSLNVMLDDLDRVPPCPKAPQTGSQK